MSLDCSTPVSRRGAKRLSRHEEIRRAAGYTVTAFARELSRLSIRAGEDGFSYPYISAVEAGREHASPRYRRAASRLLGVPDSLIFNENGRAA